MTRRRSSGGFAALLGLIAVGMIIAGIVYSVDQEDKDTESTEKSEKKVIRPQPARRPVYTNPFAGFKSDGTLSKASSVKASELGKAKPISGGMKVGSSRGGSKRSASSGGKGKPTSGDG